MSIINQMLQDLDKRRAVNEVMPGAVRPLPEPPRHRISVTTWWSGGLLILFIAIGIVYLAWPQNYLRASIAAVVPATTAPLPLVQVVAAPTVPIEKPVRAVAGVKEASAEPPLAAKQSAVGTQPEPPKVTAGNGTAQTFADSAPNNLANTDNQPPAKPLGPPAEVTVVEAKRNEPQPAAGEGRIEKQMRVNSPRERAETEYQRGINLLNTGRSVEAAAAFNVALREDVTYGAARAALAGLLIDQRRLDEAQATLQEGLAQDPKQPAVAMMLARLQTERGDLQAAASTLQMALPAAEERAEYRALYAAILQRAGRHPEATEHYAAALKLSPSNGVWWMGLGISLEAEGRVAEARQAFQSAKSSSSLSPEVAAYVEQRLIQLP